MKISELAENLAKAIVAESMDIEDALNKTSDIFEEVFICVAADEAFEEETVVGEDKILLEADPTVIH